MRPGDEWRVLRMGTVLFGFVETVYVSIPDYGYQYSLLENLYLDPAGWLHEIFAIWIGVGLFVEWTFRAEERQLRIGWIRKRRLKEV